MTPICFELYNRAAHLKGLISLADYRRIFETIWRDRAEAAGWRLAIEYQGDAGCRLRLR